MWLLRVKQSEQYVVFPDPTVQTLPSQRQETGTQRMWTALLSRGDLDGIPTFSFKPCVAIPRPLQQTFA